jgi:hypothetical protein
MREKTNRKDKGEYEKADEKRVRVEDNSRKKNNKRKQSYCFSRNLHITDVHIVT